MPHRCVTVAVALCAVAASLATADGCGSDSFSNPDGGSPLDAASFTPPAPACSPGNELCAVEFIYPYGGESSVEIFGNFQPNGWSNGVYFSQDHSIWQVFVDVPQGQPVSYKFLINGTTWVTDPANAMTDGQGNSLKAPVTCPYSYICTEPEDAGPPDAGDAATDAESG
jgi:hypothetical protein